MSDNGNHVSRRTVIKTTGGALATTGVVGLASADPDERVTVNVGTNGRRSVRAARNAATTVKREFEFGAMTLELPKQAAENVATRSDVRYVEENGEMHALDDYMPYGIDRVDADVAHANGYTGAGADVSIIDTGIDADHPDLQATLGEGRDFTGSGTWDDSNGHGTHCAGTASALDNDEGVVGVSTEATLHAAKVLGGGGGGSYSDIAAGIEWTADQGYEVGSMSLGGGYSNVVADACEYAYDSGVLLVAAAGNDGPCSDCVSYPAALPECIAVSATSEDDSLANFSSTGSEVEIAAPGVDVWSTYAGGGYEQLSGTSMACPHVAGAAAQIMAYDWSNTDTRNRLRETAEDIGLSSNEQGYGLLDVAAALGLDSSDN